MIESSWEVLSFKTFPIVSDRKSNSNALKKQKWEFIDS